MYLFLYSFNSARAREFVYIENPKAGNTHKYTQASGHERNIYIWVSTWPPSRLCKPPDCLYYMCCNAIRCYGGAMEHLTKTNTLLCMRVCMRVCRKHRRRAVALPACDVILKCEINPRGAAACDHRKPQTHPRSHTLTHISVSCYYT